MEEIEIIKMVPHVVRSMQRRIWIDYDEDADVLYMNFTYLPKAVEHEENENGIVKNDFQRKSSYAWRVCGWA